MYAVHFSCEGFHTSNWIAGIQRYHGVTVHPSWIHKAQEKSMIFLFQSEESFRSPLWLASEMVRTACDSFNQLLLCALLRTRSETFPMLMCSCYLRYYEEHLLSCSPKISRDNLAQVGETWRPAAETKTLSRWNEGKLKIMEYSRELLEEETRCSASVYTTKLSLSKSAAVNRDSPLWSFVS